MDPRADIREFLVSRRARITPEDAGLPLYGVNRRVKGLRREEVAILAGISVEYYTRLERGNASGASEDVLEGISRALQLDDAERSHLFDLVRAANTSRVTRRPPNQERVRATIQRIIDAMAGMPAYVRNGRLDILAANRLGAALYAPVPSRIGATRERRKVVSYRGTSGAGQVSDHIASDLKQIAGPT